MGQSSESDYANNSKRIIYHGSSPEESDSTTDRNSTGSRRTPSPHYCDDCSSRIYEYETDVNTVEVISATEYSQKVEELLGISRQRTNDEVMTQYYKECLRILGAYTILDPIISDEDERDEYKRENAIQENKRANAIQAQVKKAVKDIDKLEITPEERNNVLDILTMDIDEIDNPIIC